MLSQVRPALTAQIAALAEVEVIPIPSDEDPPPAVAGDVLLTYPWASPNIGAVLACGVRWVHVLGTGVDAFPFQLLTDQTLAARVVGAPCRSPSGYWR